MKTSRIDWNTLKQHGFNQRDFNHDLHQSVEKLIDNLKQLIKLQTRHNQSAAERSNIHAQLIDNLGEFEPVQTRHNQAIAEKLNIQMPDATTKPTLLSPTCIWDWDDSHVASLIKSPRSLLEKHSESDRLRQRITRLPRLFSPQKKTSQQADEKEKFSPYSPIGPAH